MPLNKSLHLAWYLFGGRGRLNFRVEHLRIVPSLIGRMLRISIGGIGQFLIATSSWILIMRIVALYGSAPDHPRHDSAHWRLQPSMTLRTRMAKYAQDLVASLSGGKTLDDFPLPAECWIR